MGEGCGRNGVIMYLRPQLRQESIIQKINHENAKEINPGKLPGTLSALSWSLSGKSSDVFFIPMIFKPGRKIVK
jgi:hypothetical protein